MPTVSNRSSSSRERTSRRSLLLKFLRRRPLRRFLEPAERWRRRRLSAPFKQTLREYPGLVTIYDDEQVWLAGAERGISPAMIRKRNLSVASTLLEAGGVPYFAVPDEARRHTTLGIESQFWDAFSDAVAAADQYPPLYLGIETENAAGQVRRSTVPAGSEPGRRALRAQDNIDLFQFQFDRDKNRHFGLAEACRVIRWNRKANATIASTSQNQRAAVIDEGLLLPDQTTIYGDQFPTYGPLAQTNLFEINEPIDAVYLWVDGQDQDWRDRRSSTIEGLTGIVTDDSIDPSRFRDNGELRYSLRSVFQHCDWIRNIVLVTDAQVPTWLDTTHPRIRMVTHQELFGEAGALPTYNSHAITSRLHHIEGLSDQFVIFNDDVFVGRDVGPSQFFLSNGMSRFFLSRKTLPRLASYPQAHEAARRNSVDLIERDFAVTAGRIFLHTPVPQLRSLLFELESRYPAVFEGTWSHQLRSPEDFQINGWMHHYIGYLLKRTVPGTISYDYFSLDDKALRARLERLLQTREKATFCINDSSNALPENIDYLQHWLRRYYPIAAPWEREP